jgi:hypothetical protein
MSLEALMATIFFSVIFAGAGYGIGYSQGKQDAESDWRERVQSWRDAEKAQRREEVQRQYEVEVERKAAGLHSVYPDARRRVDRGDGTVDY